MFSFLKRKKKFFTDEEQYRIVEAIREAERQTSGEVRVFVESHCRFMDALDRAAEIFFGLEMDQTQDRNAVLVYVATQDHQLAIFADEQIHQQAGQQYWDAEVNKMIADFNRDNLAEGIRGCVEDVGLALRTHFPYNKDNDKNELPDEIVFGK